MKTSQTETKATRWGATCILLKLCFLVMAVPVLLPATAFFVEALMWRFVLCRIEGITFAGSLLEAFALSAALGACACFLNMLIAVIEASIKKLRKLPEPAPAPIKEAIDFTWADFFKTIPGFRSLSQQLIANAAALAYLSSLHPLRLHFDGALCLLLTSGVLSACWIFCTMIVSAALYALMIKDMRGKAAASKVVV